MVIAARRHMGAFALLLGGLTFLGACVSGTADGGTNDGPECYSNSDCSGARECSAGVCVPYVGCSTASTCRNNEDCMDSICRLQCEQPADCEDQGLTCGVSDTQHCKPAPNPTRPQTQPKSGTGGTTMTGTGGGGGMASAAGGTPGTAGSPAGVAGVPAAPSAGSAAF
jgi:hypothetical protein